jgi:hypothetical protein
MLPENRKVTISIDFRFRFHSGCTGSRLMRFLKWLGPLVLVGIKIYHELHCG